MSESSVPHLPPPGEMLLVTDELGSPADFFLYRSLASHLRTSGKSTKCVILFVSGSIQRWKAVLAKSNVNLAQLIGSRAVTFLNLSSTHLVPRDDGATPSLTPVFDELRDALGEAKDTLVLVDDLSSLEWMGISSLEVSRFVRAVCSLCRKLNTSLILRHHIVTPGELDNLLRVLLQLCTYRVDIFPLSSGRSGSVSGQIALHLGAGWEEREYRPIPRSKALLYRLTDASAVFFERGTGAGVL
ncbi:uncharacterized protein PHACADRAFT_197183 [Phanerochaete carnosa HHB-10118-sp]|uniref:Elongator complex protein 5 n=1 Tax=Phanerochaete carnosa (strain HHB-10118-sp) TaxID=650164 RepID=K5W6H8_PHACS|nr:uncharacterized protein PHACADRAFT_197183 [Phanerochaete carnosa HHB-10118-sp]EKM54755.1 hypothetical protein PHACADRAFT_197183 [Phanerochaete carnosa HHB-10118-sp]